MSLYKITMLYIAIYINKINEAIDLLEQIIATNTLHHINSITIKNLDILYRLTSNQYENKKKC